MKVAIIGAGPAGLTAAYVLQKKGISTTVLEADPRYVGGIAKTVEYKGFRFDIGGHRFFSKSKEVEDFWSEILPDDLLLRPRSSRIYYRKQFFSYPLKAFEALRKLGIVEAIFCVLSYVKVRLFPIRNPKNFEEWVTNQFGARLFQIFFKTYTEKVWGMRCTDISADWAAQRIKGLSLFSAIKNAVFTPKESAPRGKVIKTLISSFRYPRLGPGMMWEVCRDRVKEQGGQIHMGAQVVGLERQETNWKVLYRDQEETLHTLEADHVISSAPLRELMLGLRPLASEPVLTAARNLKYRDFLIVALMMKDQKLFDDNWIYIHDPSVQVGRIQHFKSWSPEMVPDPSLCCYGLEYFCFQNDQMWSSRDEDLIALAKKELQQIGLIKEQSEIVDGCVVRQKKAYPVYDEDYAQNVDVIRQALEKDYPGLHLVGRNGMHKYNNQDHAMMTAMLVAENIAAGKPLYDVWQVNQDAEYHESGTAGAEEGASGLRAVPKPAATTGP